ncbi:MAG: replication-associated recombination protein A [Chloroflexi bacterium]|nr:replication-associated recombination protein A [Chloroflexota bacterium]
MRDLFDADVVDHAAPLAARMRPRSLDEVVGQQHLVGGGAPLRRAIEADAPPSCILWGPPGCGKTTIARVIAGLTHTRFSTLSAVSSGVADLRKVIAAAEAGRRDGLARTLLFIDEIHRFNKAQQDAVLHAVEDGTITLIGATTENPSFEVIAPLLSRARVYKLELLDTADIRRLLERALTDPERGLGRSPPVIEEQALDAIANVAGGDARVALNTLQAAADSLAGQDRAISVDDVAEVAQRALPYDKGGDAHFDTISAFIKSVRGSDPDAAVYWLARMLEAGENPMFVARRIVILAAEDIGLADPQALSVAVAAQQATHLIGMPECTLVLSEAAIYLARAPKSNSAMKAYSAAVGAVRESGALPVPLHLRNAATGLMAAHGYGKNYQYAHDYEGGVTPDQQHLPEELSGVAFYQPSDRDVRP